jgi:hypothetical protein
MLRHITPWKTGVEWEEVFIPGAEAQWAQWLRPEYQAELDEIMRFELGLKYSHGARPGSGFGAVSLFEHGFLVRIPNSIARFPARLRSAIISFAYRNLFYDKIRP